MVESLLDLFVSIFIAEFIPQPDLCILLDKSARKKFVNNFLTYFCLSLIEFVLKFLNRFIPIEVLITQIVKEVCPHVIFGSIFRDDDILIWCFIRVIRGLSGIIF